MAKKRSPWSGMTKEQRSVEMRRRLTLGRKRKRAAHKSTGSASNEQISFAYGYTKGWLQSYAQGLGPAGTSVTQRVVELLYHSQGG